jgi:hypothetical protein
VDQTLVGVVSPPRLKEHSNILIGYYRAISGADIPISLGSPMDQQRDTISRLLALRLELRGAVTHPAC